MASPAMLVSLEAAKGQLGITHDEKDDEIFEMLTDCEDIVLRFWGTLADDDWNELTVPGAVRAAILRQLTFMWRHRGDSDMKPDVNGFAPGVYGILLAGGFRDLTIA